MSRARLFVISVAGFALLFGFGLVCCTRSPTPAITAAPPRAADSGAADETEESEPSLPQAVGAEKTNVEAPRDEAADSAAPTIEMDEPEQPELQTPRYLSIVEQINPARRSRVHATVTPPRKLELTTENVSLLRLTREGLPLARNRSIVLRIDGQGIEWTPKYVAVELERSPAGAWTVVRRRPFKP
ncbi:MAG: hypothetical protein ACE5I3_11460 [Phycisphaerae bacterium]